MGSIKWQKEAAFIFFRQRNSTFVRNRQDKETEVLCAQLVANTNIVWAWGILSSVQSLSCLSLQPHGPQHTRPPCPSPTLGACSNSVSNAIQPSHPLLSLLLLPSVTPSISVFSNESALGIRWPKYWSFGFNISPSNEHPGLISFRMDCLDLLAVQETLKSLLQHNSSKASILWPSAFFIVQLSHPCMTTGKIIALTRWTFVDKVISLLFNVS